MSKRTAAEVPQVWFHFARIRTMPARTPCRGARVRRHATGRARVALGSIPRSPSDEWVSAFTSNRQLARLRVTGNRSREEFSRALQILPGDLCQLMSGSEPSSSRCHPASPSRSLCRKWQRTSEACVVHTGCFVNLSIGTTFAGRDVSLEFNPFFVLPEPCQLGSAIVPNCRLDSHPTGSRQSPVRV